MLQNVEWTQLGSSSETEEDDHSGIVIAEFVSCCGECEEDIEEGDEMYLVDGSWIHARHAD